MRQYLSEINPEFSEPLIQELRAFALNHHIPIMQDEGLHFLVQLIKIKQAKNILEIGTAIGYSALVMAYYSDAMITTIERDKDLYQMAIQHINRAGLKERVDCIFGDAKDVDIKKSGFDLIFIDAAKSSYIEFFEKYSKLLNPGGIIVSDNLLFRGYVAHPEEIESRNRRQLVKKIDRYNHYLLNHPKFNSYIYAIGDGISVSIKK